MSHGILRSWITSFGEGGDAAPPSEGGAAGGGDGKEPPDPIAGGQGSRGPGADAMQYPITGIINDVHSKTYLMSPDYWVYWNRVRPSSYPTRSGATAPPAVWWQQRDDWRDTWERLATGREGTAAIWNPRPYPMKKSKTESGGLFSKKNRWWEWLDGRKPPLQDQGLDTSKPGGIEEDRVGDDGPEAKKKPEKEDQNPCVSLFPKSEKDKKGLSTPGCWCPGPNCVFDNRNAEKKPKPPPIPGVPQAKPPDDIIGGFYGGAYPEQLEWVAQNSMRRQTLPGLADALTNKPNALRRASVRMVRNQDGWGKEAATLDPRPAIPVENPWQPMMKKQPMLEPYEGTGGLMGSAKHMVGNALMDATVGANMLEMRAFMRLQNQSHGEWLQRLIKYKQAEANYERGEQKAANEIMNEGKAEEEIMTKRKNKRGLKNLMEKSPEPLWHPPPPQNFGDLYEMRYRKFWPAMEVLARRGGSGPARLIHELGQEWRAQRIAPKKKTNVVQKIFEAASADIRSARGALGGPDGKEEEAINAVDQELPVPQPEIRQARPTDGGAIPTPHPPAKMKAYLGKDLGAPPAAPQAEKILNSFEQDIKENRAAQRKIRPQIANIRQELAEFDKQSKKAREAQAKVIEQKKGYLEEALSKQEDLMNEGDALMDKAKTQKALKNERWIEMHPAGRDGRGVEAKVLADSVRPLYPEFEDAPPPSGPTTYSGLGPLGATAGAVFLSTTWNDLQLLTRDARLARWRSARTRGRRRSIEVDATFL